MNATLPLGAAVRSLRVLAREAGGTTTRTRIERLAALAAGSADELALDLADVLGALYPGDERGVVRFRELRNTMRGLAAAQGVDLDCVVDGQKRADPAGRRCWFTGIDDGVDRLEQLSFDASQSPPGTRPVRALARREILRVCIDGPPGQSAEELTHRLSAALKLDRDLGVEVTDTAALAGERPEDVRSRRLAESDLAICLLSHAYLERHRDSAVNRGRTVVPVALEPLGRADLGEFGDPFSLRGKAYQESGRRKQAFVNELHEQIVARVTRPAEGGPEWECLLPDDVAPDVVYARAVRATLDKVAPTARVPDDTIDVQDHLRTWSEDAAGPPFLVIFGEYGMGKTTSCQVFTQSLLDRRRAGDSTVRLPIYLDLRTLGDLKLREPTLVEILDDLLLRTWQSGRADRPTAQEVIDHVQRRRAVIVFDGLDEVLVHLSERQGQALLRQLWSILPLRLHATGETRSQAGRVLMTCRTHFFRTLREQHGYFRGEGREVVSADAYAALHLLPFSDEQIRAYFERREAGRSDVRGVDRAIELIRAVHNLSDLVTRPYNLRLVADQLGALERRIASGERVDAAALYDELVGSWLARDDGKHQLRKDDKLRLMEELAAELWRAGRRSLPVDRLEAWLHRRLGADDELGRWFALARPDVAVLAEDLRTATFVVRPGADDFAFAHTSLLEYFLARRLARALEEGDHAAWAMPMPSAETLDFLGEIVAARDTATCLATLRALRGTYREQSSEAAFAYCLRAADRGVPRISVAGFALQGAKLRGITVTGPANGPRLSLAGSALGGADLRGARFQRVGLEGCDLRGADLTRAELHDCGLDGAQLADTKLTATIFRRCVARGLDLREACAHRTQWLRCDVSDARWPQGEAHLVASRTGCGQRTGRPDRSAARMDLFTGHSGSVSSVAFSPDGQRLASGDADGAVRVWDAAGGEEVLWLGARVDAVWGVAFSADGGRLASGGDDGLVTVWDAASGDELSRMDAHGARVRSVAFSPDGERVASGNDDGTVRVWDAASGSEMLRLVSDGGVLSGVAFSADGGRLASCAEDGSVWVWDAVGGQTLLRLDGHDGPVFAIAFSSDGKWLASGGEDGSVRVWDVLRGEELLRLDGHDGGVRGLAFSPDGVRLASGGGDRSVRVWDVVRGEELLRLDRNGGMVWGVAFSPDGERLASGDSAGWLWVCNAVDGEILLRLERHNAAELGVAFAADGGRLACGAADGTVRILDSVTGEELLRVDGDSGAELGVSFSPDGRSLASAGSDGAVRLWDAVSGKELGRLDCQTATVRAVGFSPDGRRLASGGDDGAVLVWDIVGAKELLRLDTEGAALAVAFSADGRWLASGDDEGVVQLWDVAGGKELLRLEGHAPWRVAFSPDGRRLASGGGDGSVRVWDTTGGEELLRLVGHDGMVWGMAFSPDGRWLASGGDEGVVRVWDAANGRELLQLGGHGATVWEVSFSSDGSRLASAGGDGSVRVWDLADGQELLAVHTLGSGEYASLAGGRVTACSAGAWRWLGWLAPSPVTGALTRYPAEMFGPLPVKS